MNRVPGRPGKNVFADQLSAGGTDVKRRSDSGENDEEKVTFLYSFCIARGTQVIKSYAFSRVCDSMRNCLHPNGGASVPQCAAASAVPGHINPAF